MKRQVIDASVLIKLFISEDGSREAAAALKKVDELLATDLFLPETGNILWKLVRRKELTDDEAQQILADILQMPIQFTQSADLIESALEVAVETDRTVYDCLYLALAVASKTTLLTSDERLVNALVGTRFSQHVCHTTKAR